MRKLTAQVYITFALLLVAAIGPACDKAGPPPEPLAAEEMPAAMEKAFSNAKPEIKELASQFVALVKAKDLLSGARECQRNLTSEEISIFRKIKHTNFA